MSPVRPQTGMDMAWSLSPRSSPCSARLSSNNSRTWNLNERFNLHTIMTMASTRHPNWAKTRLRRGLLAYSLLISMKTNVIYYLCNPANTPPFPFTVPSSFKMLRLGSECRTPTSKSLKSWAGVILTAPVPNAMSTYVSAITGISTWAYKLSKKKCISMHLQRPQMIEIQKHILNIFYGFPLSSSIVF